MDARELKIEYIFADGSAELTSIPMLLGGWHPGEYCGTPIEIIVEGIRYVRDSVEPTRSSK